MDGGKTDVCEIIRSKASNGKSQITIEECSICREDGCNKSTYLKMSSAIVFMSLLLIKAIR